MVETQHMLAPLDKSPRKKIPFSSLDVHNTGCTLKSLEELQKIFMPSPNII